MGGGAMFLGTHEPKLDEKGRLTLPARFRDELAGALVIAPGQEHCLNVWTRERFAAELARVQHGGSVLRKDQRIYERILGSLSHDDVPDRQGRVTIPPLLRKYARLDRDLVVIGAGDRVEIWDATAWGTFFDEEAPGFAALSEEVSASYTQPA